MCHGWACLYVALVCFDLLELDGGLLFCCLVVSCVFAYVMHGPIVMSSLFGCFQD